VVELMRAFRALRTIGYEEALGVIDGHWSVEEAIERAQLFERSVEAGAAEERNRLAREIHDTLAQGLSATALHLETAEALLEAGGEPDRVKSVVHRALEATRANLEEADLRGAVTAAERPDSTSRKPRGEAHESVDDLPPHEAARPGPHAARGVQRPG
jgi:signal transduction histidine kinase